MTILDPDLVKSSFILNEKINALGEYCEPNAYELVDLCNEYEDLISDPMAINKFFTAIAYGYEGVRRDCEHATVNPDKKNSYTTIKDYYNRGKRHLQRNVNMLIMKMDEKKINTNHLFNYRDCTNIK